MATYPGIDVSTFQGEIDWPKVKAASIHFAMIRASYGWEDRERQVDVRFHQNAEGAAAAGIPFGAYHYSYATTVEEAHEEAAFFLDVIRGYRLAYPVAYDIEDRAQKSLTKEAVTAIARAWCEDMRAAGYYPMVYSNLSFIRNYLTEEFRKEEELWIAQYNDAPTYGSPFGIWQYTSGGAVDGIAGRVDRDLSYKDYASLIMQGGYNGFEKPRPEPDPDPKPEEGTVTVKAGDTLSGIAARYGLTWQELYAYDGNRAVIGADPNFLLPGMVLHVPSAGGVKPVLRVGARVHYSGRLYGDSYGGSPGQTVDGDYTVTRIINGRKAGVLLGQAGWAPADQLTVLG
ncbi:MAG TPA: LysM peptidoglycan-binding domain-containing protein [Firmicutes bacterium]|nr:LysM peptidoglycan-binding domain-containing protein [Bacillota bacterium]